MKISDLKQMQDDEPFRPFTIHLTTSAQMPVEHPEQLHVNPEADLFDFVGRSAMEPDRHRRSRADHRGDEGEEVRLRNCK